MRVPKSVVIALSGFVAGIALMWFWDRPSDLYTCLLYEMRHQPEGSRPVAIKVCTDKFGNPRKTQ